MNTSFFEEACDAQAFLHRPLYPAATPETAAFEAALRQVFGVKEAVALCSGTAALHCALAALDIGPGDEVLVPALAVIMSIVPILYQGATPIFVDSAPGRVDFDYEDLRRKLTPRTKAILPVYLWGCSYDMDALMRFAAQHHLAVVEDACQAHGSQFAGRYLGTWGDAGCFSMYEGKLISTGGGGFLLTDNQELAEKCRGLRSHWVNVRNPALSYQQIGYNYRLSEFQAWLGRLQVCSFDALLERRYAKSVYLLNGLATTLETYQYAAQERSNTFSPVFLLDEGDVGKGIAHLLAERGVANSVGTFGLKPVQAWPVFSAGATQLPETPHAERFLSRVIAISLLPQYAEEDLERIIGTIKTTLAEVR
jgi:perosamine synthetase